jgi:drug/metabolite transporter (DMT)-like permease
MKSRALLLITAIIWGFAFVAQRKGMEFVPPFTFNAIRFAIGCISLLPLAWLNRNGAPAPANRKTILLGGISTGLVLFLGSSFQQIGVVYTTAGKAGFITGLYVILVPIVGIVLKHRTGIWTWLGAFAGIVGLYLLTVNESLAVEYGDGVVLVGAFFWAGHVLVIDHFSPRIGAIRLSLMQCAICALVSLIAALLFETVQPAGIVDGAIPILYTGILSVGVAYTLQAVGQKGTPPAQAAIIMSLEAAFAVIGGWLLLNETLPWRGLIGCGLMFIGMIVSQLDSIKESHGNV